MATFVLWNSFLIVSYVSICLAILVYFVLKDRPVDPGLDSPDELTGELIAPPAAAIKVDWKQTVKQLASMPNLWLSALLGISVTTCGQVPTALWGSGTVIDGKPISVNK